MDEYCRNCDGAKCMSCARGVLHRACEDDCPECCNPTLFEDEYPNGGTSFDYDIFY